MPPLPAELWWDILRLAVHTPGLFDTQWHYSPDFLMWTGWEVPDPSSSYFNSLQTKLSVSLVSKSWREIGVELLYEHLLLTEDVLCSGVLSKLIAIFEQHAGQSGYGRSTKQVDIFCQKSRQPWFPSLLRLLELCHNVRIFNVTWHLHRTDDEKQFELSSLLQHRFSHSLRRMKIYVHSPNELVYFPNVPLEALELSTIFSSTIDPPPAIATVSTLCVDLLYSSYQAPSWRFPALRYLTLSNIVDADLPSLRLFMTLHGPQLHSLHITIFEDSSFLFLPQLLAPATNLRSLVLSPLSIYLPQAGSSFPSITHIGLQPYLFPRLSDMESLISGSVFPGLQCIRFLDLSNPVNPEQNDIWLPLLEIGFKRNIRFEGNKRQLIQIR